jgi:predicted metal-dependent hydrolase
MNNVNFELPKNVKQGLLAFNQKSYFQAHEYFEDAWRESDDPSREFFRALLHISGGFFRLTEGKPQAAKKFFQHALKWLDDFESNYLGFDNANLKQMLEELIIEIDDRKHPEGILEQFKSSIFSINTEASL